MLVDFLKAKDTHPFFKSSAYGQLATKSIVEMYHLVIFAQNMAEKQYFDPKDLRKFGSITEWQEAMGKKFFDWYGEVFAEGALTEREKALIALAVSHSEQCPYCIDAYTTTCLEKGADEEQMMEAIHVAAAIKSGSTLVYGVQMMNHAKKLSM